MQGSRNKKKNKTTSVYRLFYVKKKVHLQQSKGIQSSINNINNYMWKRHHLSLIEGMRKGTFFVKNGIQKGKGLDFLEFCFSCHCGLHEFFQAFWPV